MVLRVILLSPWSTVRTLHLLLLLLLWYLLVPGIVVWTGSQLLLLGLLLLVPWKFQLHCLVQLSYSSNSDVLVLSICFWLAPCGSGFSFSIYKSYWSVCSHISLLTHAVPYSCSSFSSMKRARKPPRPTIVPPLNSLYYSALSRMVVGLGG